MSDANLVIATPDLGDAGDISASDEVPAYPASNLLLEQPWQVWRTTGLSGIYIEHDMGQTVTMRLIALLYAKLSSTATWRARAAATQADLTTASALYDSGTQDVWPDPANASDYDYRHLVAWIGDAGVSARWSRIDISDPDNAAGYIQAARYLPDEAWRPETGRLTGGTAATKVEEFVEHTTTGGQTYRATRGKIGRFTYRIVFKTADELRKMRRIYRRRGQTRAVLLVGDIEASYPDLHDETTYCFLDQVQEIQADRYDWFEAVIKGRELL